MKVAVEALGDVRRQRHHVAVVEVQAERLGVELVDELLAGVDLPATAALADPRHAVHEVGVDPVEVDRVRVLGAVDEADPQPVALGAAEGRAGDAAVVGPGGIGDAGRDLDVLVLGDRSSTRAGCGRRAACWSCRSRSRERARSGRSRWRRGRRWRLPKPSCMALPSAAMWPAWPPWSRPPPPARDGRRARRGCPWWGTVSCSAASAGAAAAPVTIRPRRVIFLPIATEILTHQNLEGQPPTYNRPRWRPRHRSSSTGNTGRCARAAGACPARAAGS